MVSQMVMLNTGGHLDMHSLHVLVGKQTSGKIKLSLCVVNVLVCIPNAVHCYDM